MYLSSNMKQKQIILTKDEINNKINRIAFSIIEEFYLEKKITIVGFEKNGHIIGEKLKKIIEQKQKIKINLHKITHNTNNQYTIQPSLQKETQKNIFLVDDVLKSGKTIIYGIKEILKQDINSLKTIILVNRNHHQFPVSADYVGLNLSTTLKDHIEVILTEKEEVVYLT